MHCKESLLLPIFNKKITGIEKDLPPNAKPEDFDSA
jgi:hypothetical protein